MVNLIDIEPLDIVFFKGTDIVSDFIRLNEKIDVGNGDWSHIGIVVTTELMPIKNGKKNKLYIWESVLSGKLHDGVYNVETGETFFGTQIRDLKKVISASTKQGVKMAIGKLKNNPYLKQISETDDDYNNRKKELYLTMKQLYKRYNHVRFQYNCFRLFTSMYTICDCLITKNNTDRLFCSQLVGVILNKLNVINIDDTSKLIPVDLISENSEVGNIIKKLIIL